jgi:signal peptidase I
LVVNVLRAVAVIGAVGAVLARRSLIVVEVVGGSMAPTYASGARLLAVRGRSARRGEVVVLRHRDAPPGATDYLVKRLVAGPGDLVPPAVRAAVGVHVVPAGQCVVLGDDPNSVDSRVWGFVPLADLVGRVVRVLGGPSQAASSTSSAQ